MLKIKSEMDQQDQKHKTIKYQNELIKSYSVKNGLNSTKYHPKLRKNLDLKYYLVRMNTVETVTNRQRTRINEQLDDYVQRHQVYLPNHHITTYYRTQIHCTKLCNPKNTASSLKTVLFIFTLT